MPEQILKKTYKYRLYPTKIQQDILEKHLSLCRWLYNHFLEEKRNAYKKDCQKISCFNQIKKIPKLKKEKPELKEIKQIVGLDVGLTSFLTTDNGEKIDNLRYLTKSEEKLCQIQRKHSRKKLKSNNRSKSRLRVAKLYERIASQRLEFLHKLSNKLISNFQLIAFEKLNIKGMVKNRYLAKSISDASWDRFLQQLKYKAAEAGVWAVGVNPQGTTQICSSCNSLVRKTLNQRIHKCFQCGLTIDRDINAARNILKLALTTVGTTGINACGAGELSPTLKQEAIGFNRW